MEVKIISHRNYWTHGACGPYEFWCKHFDLPSRWGIEADLEHGPGRVSKLEIRRAGAIVCNYDRGWDVLPVTDADLEALALILDRFN